MKRIDLNVDIGEGFPHDDALLRFASSASVCCGEHAGSWELTTETVKRCRDRGVRVGVHPGYPDRPGVGRKPIDRDHELSYFASIRAQMNRFCQEWEPAYLKPHGAFYNDTAVKLPHDWDTPKDSHPPVSPYQAGGLYLAHFPGVNLLSMLLRVHVLPLMGLAPTAHAQIAERAMQPLIHEGFADRAYRPDGTLVPRNEAGAVLANESDIRAQIRKLAPRVDSICLHGDTPHCVEYAELVVATLKETGYEVGV